MSFRNTLKQFMYSLGRYAVVGIVGQVCVYTFAIALALNMTIGKPPRVPDKKLHEKVDKDK